MPRFKRTLVSVAAAIIAGVSQQAGADAQPGSRISAQVVNNSFQEMNLNVVDDICGNPVYQGRLEAESQVEVVLCTDAVNHGRVRVYDQDSGREKKHQFGIFEGGKILVH